MNMIKRGEGIVRARAESIGEQCKRLEKENKRLNAAIEQLLIERKQWTDSKEQWNRILQKTLTISNEASAKVSEEVQRLRTENTKLREELGYNTRGT